MAKRSGKRSKKASARKVPVARHIALLSFVFTVTAGLLATFFTVPQLNSSRQASAELAAADDQIAQLLVRLREAAGSGDAQLALLYETVQVLEDAIPSAPAREQLTVQVVQLAESSGVQVQRLDPAAESAESSAEVGRHQFNVRFSGTYASLLTFLDRLEQLGPLVTLSAVQLSAQGDVYLISGTMSFWYVKVQRLTDELGVPTFAGELQPDQTGELFAPEPQLEGAQDPEGDAATATDGSTDPDADPDAQQSDGAS